MTRFLIGYVATQSSKLKWGDAIKKNKIRATAYMVYFLRVFVVFVDINEFRSKKSTRYF